MLPQPYRLCDELLNELIDDFLQVCFLEADAAQELSADTESDAVSLAPMRTWTLPSQIPTAGTLVSAISSEVLAIATPPPTSCLLLWDLSTGHMQTLTTSDTGLVPVSLQCVAPTPSNPVVRQRLALLSEGEADGMGKLLLLDLAPPVHVDPAQRDPQANLPTADWVVSPIGALDVNASSAGGKFSADGLFYACALRDGAVAVYSVPLPPSPKGGDASKVTSGDAPEVAPQLVLTSPSTSVGSAAGAVCVHFLLAPAPRGMGEALSWGAVGLLTWHRGERGLRQLMLPSRTELASPLSDGTGAPPALQWLFPYEITASAASLDSVFVALGLADGS